MIFYFFYFLRIIYTHPMDLKPKITVHAILRYICLYYFNDEDNIVNQKKVKISSKGSYSWYKAS